MQQQIFDKYKVAIQAALASSEEILKVYQTDFDKYQKEDGSPVTSADLASSKIIAQYLRATNIPITGEELQKSPYTDRKNWKQVWCVDPLDGTKEFIKKNGEFVINIALIENHISTFGLIASPIKREIIIGEKEGGAFQFKYEDALFPERWQKIQPLQAVEDKIHIISSRSHYTGNLLKLAQNIEKEYGETSSSNMGSALKFFELVNGRAHVYPRFAPTMEWDIAAGQAIYEALGGKVISLETGTSMTYNKEDLHNPFFIAYNPFLQIPLEY